MKLPALVVTMVLIAAQAANACSMHDYADAPKDNAAAMEKMHHAMMIDYTGDPDVDFVRGMIPHHQGAVDMAKIVLRDGKDPFMRRLAEWIIFIQKIEIAEMNGWLRRKGPPVQPFAPEAVDEYKAEMKAMHHAMMVKPTGDADMDFALGMIPHHQGAVEMAATLLRYGKSAELKELARGIVDSQRHEIAYMEKWIQKQKASK